jgi:hypothetical protein
LDVDADVLGVEVLLVVACCLVRLIFNFNDFCCGGGGGADGKVVVDRGEAKDSKSAFLEA